MTLAKEDPLLTVREVAARLRTTEETVRRWLREGKLKGVRPGGARFGWRVPESAVTRRGTGGFRPILPDSPSEVRDYVEHMRGPIDGAAWGPWTLSQTGDEYFLVYNDGKIDEYYIQLSSVKSRADIVGWLGHLAMKSWATANDLGNLVKALHDVSGSLEFFGRDGEELKVDLNTMMRQRIANWADAGHPIRKLLEGS